MLLMNLSLSLTYLFPYTVMKQKLFFTLGLLANLYAYPQASWRTITMDTNRMETIDTNRGPYALIAGGSKGIGYAIAEAFAKRHYNLVLVARHADSLQA